MTDKYKGKYFSILGDSLSTFEGYNPSGYAYYYGRANSYISNIYDWKDTWWGYVIDHFGAELLVNDSWSGSYLCQAANRILESSASSDARTGNLAHDGIAPDVILVNIGTNDRGARFALYSEDKSDMTVIDNAYNAMLEKLKRNYPKAEIWCCTFCKTTCELEPYFVFPKYNGDVLMEDYSELVINAAKKHGCGVIDIFGNAGLCDTIECLHPNYNGMMTMAKEVIRAMEK